MGDFYENQKQPACTGGGRATRVKLISLALISSLALSGTFFFSCANSSDGGSGSGDDSPTSTVGGSTQTPVGGDGGTTNQTTSLSAARWSCATSEEETSLGNKVSEVLCLFDENKFELQKNISYSSQNESISFFQTFYKGTYKGSIFDGMTFEIEEELDTKDFDEEMNQVFNLGSAETQSARLASDAASRSAMPAARAASRSTATILAECQTKLKDAKFKTAENKTISLETGKDSVTLTNADGNKKEVMEKAIGTFINLDGFLFTGNPCNTRTKENPEWHWANTVEEGAKALEKTADGKYTCQFRADSDDTLIRLFWNDWAADWGLSSIDKENSTLPSGAGITDDTQAVNNKEEYIQYQNPRNIAITGLEAKRKYDITFDTKKSPGKICIELAEHKISTLDGWLFTGSSTGWSGDTASGDLLLKKIGNTWQVSFTANEGWCGFNLCKPKWEDKIGWSSFDWENRWNTYNELRGSNVGKYALEDDDVIAFRNDFEGTEKITLTFGINSNGRITCKTDIEYTEEFEVNGFYFAWTNGEKVEKPVLIENKKVEFTAVNDSKYYDDTGESFTQIHLLKKINGNPPAGGSLEGSYYEYADGACWYDGNSYYYFMNFSRLNSEKNKFPSGVFADVGEYYTVIKGLTTGQTYTLTFDTTSTIGKFSLNIE